MTSEAEEITLFSELHNHLRKEDYQKAILSANKILQKLPSDLDALKTKIVALIRLGQYDKALQAIGDKKSLEFEKAYCAYKLKNVPLVRILCEGASPAESQKFGHVLAQLLYRENQHDEAIEIYGELAQDYKSGDDLPELRTNLLAAYVAGGKSQDALKLDWIAAEQNDTDSYELAYNIACAHAQKGDFSTAERLLRNAEAQLRQIADSDDLSPEEVENEAAVVLAQLAYVLQQMGHVDRAVVINKNILKSKPSDDAVLAVASNNLVVMRKDKDLFDSWKRLKNAHSKISEERLSPSQLETFLFNRATVLCLMNKVHPCRHCNITLPLNIMRSQGDECREALKDVEKRYPDNETPALIMAALLVREKRFGEACALVKKKVTSIRGQLTLAYISLVQGKCAEAIQIVESIESIRYQPGTVATLVALYDSLGQSAKAIETFERALAWRKNRMTEDEAFQEGTFRIQEADAAYKLAHGQAEDAATAYRRIVDGGSAIDPPARLRALASLVISTSQFDAKAAEIEAARLPPLHGLEKDAEELEAEVPRIVNSRAAKTMKIVDVGEKKAERKRKSQNPEKVKRKRAKRREAYLQKLVERGEITDVANAPRPDPERWIPRKQRSYAKRGRKARNKFVGAQGAGVGTELDSHRFDAAARAAERKAQAEKKQEAKVATGPTAMERRAMTKKRR